jgi:branched-chain amino acid transport system permease protein
MTDAGLTAPAGAHPPAATGPGPIPVYRVTRGGRTALAARVGFLTAVGLLITVPFTQTPNVANKLVSLFVLVLLASMWNLLAGFGGMVSAGQQGFIGIGAYSLLFLAQSGMNPYVAVPLAALAAGALSLPISLLAFRLRGGYFAIGTWVIAEVLRQLVVRVDALGAGTGASLTGLSEYEPAIRQANTFWVALAGTAFVLACLYLLLRSSTGAGLTAIRDNEVAAASTGVRVAVAKRLLFALAAAGCGLAGALTLVNSLRVQPESEFSIQWTAFMIFCAVIGGIGTLEGPVLGAVLFFLLEDRLADSGTLYLVALGALAIVIAAYLPAGVWGLAQKHLGVTLFPVGHRLVVPDALTPADDMAMAPVAAAGHEEGPVASVDASSASRSSEWSPSDPASPTDPHQKHTP